MTITQDVKQDINGMPLDKIDVSRPELFQGDTWQTLFARLRKEAPVHYLADSVNIDRPNARAHVAFGFGVHRCMGNRLAELQLRVLWEEIMKRFHTLEVVGDVERLPNNFIRGIKNVPVRLHAA